jgi:hypothetical protein
MQRCIDQQMRAGSWIPPISAAWPFKRYPPLMQVKSNRSRLSVELTPLSSIGRRLMSAFYPDRPQERPKVDIQSIIERPKANA